MLLSLKPRSSAMTVLAFYSSKCQTYVPMPRCHSRSLSAECCLCFKALIVRSLSSNLGVIDAVTRFYEDPDFSRLADLETTCPSSSPSERKSISIWVGATNAFFGGLFVRTLVYSLVSSRSLRVLYVRLSGRPFARFVSLDSLLLPSVGLGLYSSRRHLSTGERATARRTTVGMDAAGRQARKN